MPKKPDLMGFAVCEDTFEAFSKYDNEVLEMILIHAKLLTEVVCYRKIYINTCY